MAFVGQTFTQKPHEVHLSFILGLNIARKSIALSIHGSLQEKHIVLFQEIQESTSISNFTSINFLYSKFKTSFGQASAHLLQYVQPLFVKSSFGVESSCIKIIFSSQTVLQIPSQLVQFVKKIDSSLKYGGLTTFSCFSFFEKDEARELNSSLLFIIYLTPSLITSIKFDFPFKPSLLNSGAKLFAGASVAVDCGA